MMPPRAEQSRCTSKIFIKANLWSHTGFYSAKLSVRTNCYSKSDHWILLSRGIIVSWKEGFSDRNTAPWGIQIQINLLTNTCWTLIKNINFWSGADEIESEYILAYWSVNFVQYKDHCVNWETMAPIDHDEQKWRTVRLPFWNVGHRHLDMSTSPKLFRPNCFCFELLILVMWFPPKSKMISSTSSAWAIILYLCRRLPFTWTGSTLYRHSGSTIYLFAALPACGISLRLYGWNDSGSTFTLETWPRGPWHTPTNCCYCSLSVIARLKLSLKHGAAVNWYHNFAQVPRQALYLDLPHMVS